MLIFLFYNLSIMGRKADKYYQPVVQPTENSPVYNSILTLNHFQ